ncbi:hypothetical protein EDB83DRAFT_2296495 [Lactarius deliciosus]|nr:hypothetical protein EDB83DRAFT_2296495 [Lactarius deliciosus]
MPSGSHLNIIATMATAPLASSPSTGDSSNSSTTAAKKSTAPQQVEQSQRRGDDTTTYSDPSGAIFSLYLARASKFDDENVENWKGGADDILIFTGLFSSTVASLIAVSYPNLQQDPNTNTENLLAQISRQLSSAFPNGTSPAASPPTQDPFSPSATVVFINSVWFLSLVLSLTCALIATLLQQWARRYLQLIQRNHAPHDRAHIREYFYRGALKFHIFGLVETLPLLLLVSVFLFFAGLIAFALHANHTVAWFTVATVGFCSLSYIALTLMPLKYHDCPYHTPFTSFLWYSAQIIPRSFLSVLYHGAKQLHDRWGTVSDEMVESFRHRYESKVKSFSEGIDILCSRTRLNSIRWTYIKNARPDTSLAQQRPATWRNL